MPRLMGLQPCPQDSDRCSWWEGSRPARGGEVEPGQALSGGRRSMADTQGWFSRGEVIPESDPGPQGRVGLCLGSSGSSPEVSFQVRPPGVPSRRVLQACPPGASSRCALQVCPPGVSLQVHPPGVPSRHVLQVCPPGAPSRRLLQVFHPETLPMGTPPPRTPQQKDNIPTSPRSLAKELLAEAGGGRDGACRVQPSHGPTG